MGSITKRGNLAKSVLPDWDRDILKKKAIGKPGENIPKNRAHLADEQQLCSGRTQSS